MPDSQLVFIRTAMSCRLGRWHAARAPGMLRTRTEHVVWQHQPSPTPLHSSVTRGASDKWLLYAGSALENKPANFDAYGAFYESLGYTDLALGAYLPFMLSWNTAFTSS